MFGVGENPVFLERVAAREERRRLSGEAEAEAEERRREMLISSFMADGTPIGSDSGRAPPMGTEPLSAEPTSTVGDESAREETEALVETEELMGEGTERGASVDALEGDEVTTGLLNALFAAPAELEDLDDDLDDGDDG
jgi:hypothetical protein